MILDTNFISALAAGNELALASVGNRRTWVPAIVLAEYMAGLGLSKHRVELEGWVNLNLDHDEVVLDVTRVTARHYAAIWQELKAIGKPISQNDIWIAALAREHRMPIVSRDAHFDAVPGIQRLSW